MSWTELIWHVFLCLFLAAVLVFAAGTLVAILKDPVGKATREVLGDDSER